VKLRIPKGKLIAIGGNVDKGSDAESALTFSHLNFFEFGILQRILSEMRGKDSKIEVITTASMIPKEVGAGYLEAFARLGCFDVGLMHVAHREDTLHPEYAERLSSCDGIMMTGGNQMRLSSIWGGTDLFKIISDRYWNDNFTIAGTSAGAMAMSGTMIYEGDSADALLKGAVKITSGLALIDHVIIDTHFDKRGRFGRLAQAVASNPGCIGLGLGEDTGVLINSGNFMETIGSGMVLIFDGHHIQHNTIADLPEGFPISIENLIIHVMAKGYGYDVGQRKFMAQTEVI
jgi:cyanophycinase